MLLWRSRTWSLPYKLLGTLVLPGGPLGFVVFVQERLSVVAAEFWLLSLMNATGI